MITVKSRVNVEETAKLTVDPALLWIQNCSKAACIESFSLESRQTKTQLIITANQK